MQKIEAAPATKVRERPDFEASGVCKYARTRTACARWRARTSTPTARAGPRAALPASGARGAGRGLHDDQLPAELQGVPRRDDGAASAEVRIVRAL